VRRAIYRVNGTAQNVVRLEAESWLSLAKTARRFGDDAASQSALLNLRRSLAGAEDTVVRDACMLRSKIQRAELFKQRNDMHDALQALEPFTELFRAEPECPVRKLYCFELLWGLYLGKSLMISFRVTSFSLLTQCTFKIHQKN
jgi:hypothetical protein